MSDRPGGADVVCSECGQVAVAIIPKDSGVSEDEETADGSVWVTCRNCGERFRVYYRNEG